MKKLLIAKKVRRSAFLFLAAIAAGIVTYFAKSEEPMSDVALANIEALADNEGGGGYYCCIDRTICRGDYCGSFYLVDGSGIIVPTYYKI